MVNHPAENASTMFLLWLTTSRLVTLTLGVPINDIDERTRDPTCVYQERYCNETDTCIIDRFRCSGCRVYEVRCPDGRCTPHITADCKGCHFTETACRDGTCVSSPRECDRCLPGEQECNDGSCVWEGETCESCRLGYYKCMDSTCVWSPSLCWGNYFTGDALMKLLLVICAVGFTLLSCILSIKKREQIRQAMNRRQAERAGEEGEVISMTQRGDVPLPELHTHPSHFPIQVTTKPPPYSESGAVASPLCAPPTYDEACGAQRTETT